MHRNQQLTPGLSLPNGDVILHIYILYNDINIVKFLGLFLITRSQMTAQHILIFNLSFPIFDTLRNNITS